jgi:hypothetical protein
MHSGSSATKRAKDSRSPTQNNEIPELHNRVALRAYQFFEDRGRIHGHDLDDWFRAEQEILSEQIDADFG